MGLSQLLDLGVRRPELVAASGAVRAAYLGLFSQQRWLDQLRKSGKANLLGRIDTFKEAAQGAATGARCGARAARQGARL